MTAPGTQFALKILLAALFLAGADALGQTNSHSSRATNGAAAGPERAKQRPLPYHGKVGAVDKSARSFTVGKRTFYISAQTKLSKNSQPVRLEHLAIGEWVTGSYIKAADGKLVAATVYIGGKTPAAKSQ